MNNDECRWERSEWPHPKFPREMKQGLLPDVIWIRWHWVFRGSLFEEVTGWQSTDPSPVLDNQRHKRKPC